MIPLDTVDPRDSVDVTGSVLPVLDDIAQAYEPVIYLAGHFKRDDYRAVATAYLHGHGFKVLDPFRADHDLRGQEAGAFKQIVQWDLHDVVQCNGVLANFTDMSVGTSMECWFAKSIGRPVYAFVEDPAYPDEESVRISPWIEYVAVGHNVWRSLDAALDHVRREWER